MKNRPIIGKAAGLLILLVLLILCACTDTTDTENNDDTLTITNSQVGTYGDYTYEFWNQNETGDATMILRQDGSFETSWNNIYNMLARYGIRPGDGVESVTYNVDGYSATKGVSYLCVYGWAYNGSYQDLVEFYIVDNWITFRPPGGGGTYYDTITVDGDSYDIYTSIRVNQPSIAGPATFTQYWSVRQNGDQRTSGTIDVQAHFDAWANAGLPLGSTLHEVSFCIEAWGGDSGGSGYADVNELGFETE
ncbi:MAG: glycoside hydrolase family 11 protein [Spirochaetales bacterium]|nr:glycoside hydrolase family 11 protein [Spirochaetales bacterium]